MAVGVTLFFEGLTASDYDKINDLVIAAGTPDGCLLHTAGATEAGWQVWDIWESAAKFDAFMTTLAPKFTEAGITTKPHVTVVDFYNVWTPGITELTALGAQRGPVARV